jgi:hemerythrin-like metal-binding protein
MKELIWDDKYAIGVEEIDRQHMEFIKLLRRFNIGIQKAIPVAVQLRILQELVKYADYHFTSEENIMIFTKYPHLVTQQSEHSKLLSSLDRRVDGYKRAPENGEQFSDFLYDWFVNHTQIEDRKIADYIGHVKEIPS